MLLTPADVESGVKVSFHACSFKSKSKLWCNPLLKPKTHCHICIYHLAHFHIPQLSKHQHQMIRGVPVSPFQYKFLYTSATALYQSYQVQPLLIRAPPAPGSVLKYLLPAAILPGIPDHRAPPQTGMPEHV